MKFNAEELFDLTTDSPQFFKVTGLDESYAFCRKVAFSHYENFPVASILLPKQQRDYIAAIYTFARIADDIADELTEIPIERRLDALARMEALLRIKTHNPVFMAIAATMAAFSIPSLPFQKLLEAFRRDVGFVQPENFDSIKNYCEHSANPVGELVLRIFGLYSAETAPLSDAICTGLQLVNFWQDLTVDLKKERCYIPKDYLIKYELSKENLQDEKKSIKLELCLSELYDLTESFFTLGRGLIPLLKHFKLKLEIAATIAGGSFVLDKVRMLGTDILNKRPAISGKIDVLRVIFRTITRELI
ncbi:MAG: squalene synthase HpnC [Ignavibacteria bacterium]|nr:squalene synthase HpnC [Ignavibacteria bacterium]